MAVETPEQHEILVQSLMDSQRWAAGGGQRQRIDTHISTVVLAGDRAYKIKKPLDLGFLNFLAIDDRRAACDEELRLNRRLAPDLYLAVCAIIGTPEKPAIAPAPHASAEAADEPIIDWAVMMRRFDPDAILSNPSLELSPQLIDRLAECVAAFHDTAAVCDAGEAFGTPTVVAEPMRQNFATIGTLAAEDATLVAHLQRWTTDALVKLANVLTKRKADGHVRECHGDLHLGNIALIDDEPVVFDAIEFNAGLRWIDTINDAAFLTMDLHHRDMSGLAYRFLDRYLQHTGDYTGIAVLQLYQVYRAMVRAKIAAIRAGQDLSRSDRTEVQAELRSYLQVASRLSEPGTGAVVITYGVSGSGKSTVAAQLPGVVPAIRIRSDVERKRLLAIDPTEDATARGAYTASLTEDTYTRLLEAAGHVSRAGYIALVDATFLKADYRDRFAALARATGVAFAIIDCDAEPDILRERICRRRREADNVSDADLEVLAQQLRQRDPLTPGECELSIPVRPDVALDVDGLRQLIAQGA